MAMNKAEQELLDYMKQVVDPTLYPKCEGFFKTFIHAVWQSGMREAIDICKQQQAREIDTPHGYGPKLRIEPDKYSIADAILTAANKPDSNPNPHIVFHGKEPER